MMAALLVIYILGVVLVGGTFVWYISVADEDITLFDVIKMILLTCISWLAVVLFALYVVCMWLDERFGKIVIKKGKYDIE